MTKYTALGVLLALSPLVVCCIHAVLSRLLHVIGVSVAPQLSALASVTLGNVAILWLAWGVALHNDDFWFGSIYVLLTYNALGFCYFCVLNVSETSLHVHIIMDIWIAGSIPPEELARRYSAQHMIAARIERMIALGQLKQLDGRFVSANRILVLTGRAIHMWRKVLGLPLSPP